MDYLTGVTERLKTEGIVDEEFIELFFKEQGDLEPEFRTAAEDGHVESTLQAIVDAAKSRYQYWSAGDGATRQLRTESGEIRPKRQYQRKRKTEKADAWKRQEAVGRYLVDKFRPSGSRLLGGKLLTVEETANFLSSPLAAEYPPEFVGLHGVSALLAPIVIEEGEDDKSAYKVVKMHGERGPQAFKIRPLGRALEGFPVFPGDTVSARIGAVVLRPVSEISYIAHPHKPGESIATKKESVLAALAGYAKGGFHGYPISPEKALWFILTGEFVPSDPVKIGYQSSFAPGYLKRTRITIEVEGWITAEEVADHYRHAQKQVFGGIPRSLDAKSLAVLEFVGRNREKTWQQRLEAWNKEYPAWHYNQPGHLLQKHKRVLKKLIGGKDAP